LDHINWLWMIPGLPLMGSLITGVLHFLTLKARRENPDAKGPAALAGPIAAGMVGLSFVLAVRAFLAIRGEEVTSLTSTPWAWIPIDGDLTASVAMVIDRLSGAMALVVTGVGFLIHVYATGYMKGDRGTAKFFAYLNLFVAMMLVLILSSSLVGTFVGWEGVGLCSYLLIGFWYDKQGGWPAEAGQKAFIMNRVGDAAFLLGMFLVFQHFGSFDYGVIAQQAGVVHAGGELGLLPLAALLLFGGACGKSAQGPLFTWLPDAMAGPTPVSALIHAATMVTSGIYLVIRLNPLFALSPEVMYIVALVGVVTAFVAGSTAMVQRDLKGVLAYSTVSQLGYMFLALGSGAWVAALFHVITHAFFKALLFLGAGSVIHGMHEEQDMHKMGGLRRHMPRTFITFLAGAAALSGLPLMSGFFSKDEILAHTFAAGGTWYLLWFVGLITAAMTAYYTWRMVALTFFGQERFDVDEVHPHESPATMTVPLMVLAVLAIGGGLLGLPHVVHLPHLLKEWLAPVTHGGDEILGHGAELPALTEWLLLGLGSVVALFFADRGFHRHKHGLAADEAFDRARPALAGTLANAWGIDQAYQKVIVAPVKLLAVFVAVVIDQLAIDGIVNGLGRGARGMGERLKRFADGSIAGYGLWMGAGAATLALLWTWMGA
jgi:NADH-quinone oxidoreductase subunit L